MAIIIALSAAFLFVMACAVVWNLMGSLDLEPGVEAEAPAEAVTTVATNGRCMLCDQPLRRMATRDEVVCAIERHIGSENATVLDLLRRPEPENIQRLYLA